LPHASFGSSTIISGYVGFRSVYVAGFLITHGRFLLEALILEPLSLKTVILEPVSASRR